MRERLVEDEYKAKYLQLKYAWPEETTQEEWREFHFELLLHLMEQNKEILERLKERD